MNKAVPVIFFHRDIARVGFDSLATTSLPPRDFAPVPMGGAGPANKILTSECSIDDNDSYQAIFT